MDFLIPIVNGEQMRICDAATIKNEPISSRELMERASRALYRELQPRLQNSDEIAIVCGPGNNGGDGLCVARMLIAAGFSVTVFRCLFEKKASAENQFHFELLQQFYPHKTIELTESKMLDLSGFTVVVDALFGTGFSNNPSPDFANVIEQINRQNNSAKIFSIDMPSGLTDETPQPWNSFVHAHLTLTIQFPKRSLFFEENALLFSTVHAGIEMQDFACNYFYLSAEEKHAKKLLGAFPEKTHFSNKKSFGHVLLVGGNTGMHGAIVLATTSCIANGAGLTTALAPAGARLYLGAIPKAMHLAKKLHKNAIPDLRLDKFDVLCIGPGLGNKQESTEFLEALLQQWHGATILDADALNILARHDSLWAFVPQRCLLTPHDREFRRLFGDYGNTAEKLEIAQTHCARHKIYMLLKGAYSCLVCPGGKVIFSGISEPKMSQGGSGDRLAGAIAAWLARTSDVELAVCAALYHTRVNA